MKTAEEVLGNYTPTNDDKCDWYSPEVAIDAMIEFAKLHVKAALERAYRNQGMSWTNSTNEETKKELFIRNSYPLDNIK